MAPKPTDRLKTAQLDKPPRWSLTVETAHAGAPIALRSLGLRCTDVRQVILPESKRKDPPR